MTKHYLLGVSALSSRKSVIWNIDSEKMVQIYQSSSSLSEIASKLNLTISSGNFNNIKRRLTEVGCDIQELQLKSKSKSLNALKCSHASSKIPLDRILIIDSPYRDNRSLKKRLLEEQLIIHECSSCGIGPKWNEKELVLQLDHKNGINNDNRLINLRLLCPNCHSQTETFCGRHKSVHKRCSKCNNHISKRSTLCRQCHKQHNIDNREMFHKVNRPTRDALSILISSKTFVEIGREFNVSDNAVRKWCKDYGLPHLKRTIKS
jgi:hypothetical protein